MSQTLVHNVKKKGKKANVRIARTRRQRGYHWEDTLVKRFNSAKDWSAMRLGSPSIGLPDVMAVSTKYDTIFAIEAKSGTVNSLPVPADQIERCKKIIGIFDKYTERKVILAFKFLSKKRTGNNTYEWRPICEYFKVWDVTLKAQDCVCTYNGRTYIREDKSQKDILMQDCNLPFVPNTPNS